MQRQAEVEVEVVIAVLVALQPLGTLTLLILAPVAQGVAILQAAITGEVMVITTEEVQAS